MKPIDESRRAFLRAVAAGGAAMFASRGREGLLGLAAADARVVQQAAERGAIRLDSNENPYGPGPAALEAIRAALGDNGRALGRYQNDRRDLIDALARTLGASPTHVVVGTGSTEMLRVATHTLTSPTHPLVQAAPTYDVCAQYADVIGTPVRRVPVDQSLRVDLDAMASACSGAGLVYLCNPNNPTATAHPPDAIRAFVAGVNRASPDTAILIDEAYEDYVEAPWKASLVPLALTNPRVIVARTFSKLHGLAGLRVGYAVGDPRVIEAMSRAKGGGTNVLNVLSWPTAIASLDDSAHLDAERARNREAREYTRRELEKIGCQAGESHANFLFVDVGRPAVDVREACRRENVLIGRPFPPLATHVRISIGTIEEMRRATGIFRRILG